ncbi:MAG: nicotinate-nucleotide--dimethylbenzimidazole phosphoribosyltransferase [Coriobacteriales bacterium]|jgi:nicotinate-nucleotide--dimethylbenzimidazole phosphoribosyltransferase
MDLATTCSSIPDSDEGAARAARVRWDSIAKPLHGLGLLEDAVARIAALRGTPEVELGKRAVVVMCADNGVVAEGVTQTGQEVTAIVAGNITCGDASVCHMARIARADVFSVNMGMVDTAEVSYDFSIAPQTGNIAEGPAMSRGQAGQAIAAGLAIADDLAAQGYGIIATGEMGIGNTTTASAIISVLLGLPVEEVTGRGAGLSDEGLERKVAAIGRAIAVNHPDPDDALDVLAKLGGFDIAGMVGLFIGGAIHRIPVLIDGFISACAALVVARLCPRASQAMFATHLSGEPATRLVLGALGLEPLVCAGMHLGEGTGAVAALPLLDMALSVYNGMVSFEDISIEAYTPQGGA